MKNFLFGTIVGAAALIFLSPSHIILVGVGFVIGYLAVKIFN